MYMYVIQKLLLLVIKEFYHSFIETQSESCFIMALDFIHSKDSSFQILHVLTRCKFKTSTYNHVYV